MIEVPLTITSKPKVIDYENSRYRTDFWIGQGREYEDLVERKALRKLLPKQAKTVIELGAGFGRLAPLYSAYDQVVLVDYSMSLLQEAYSLHGHDNRFKFVAANLYELPFVANVADVVVMIRVMHHLEQPALALTEVARVLQGGKWFIFEFANKRNLKALLRFFLRRQSWNPFDPAPYEFVPLNYDFHPDWMLETVRSAGFAIEQELALSHFRLGLLKQHIPPRWLAGMDSLLFTPGAHLKVSPSVMARATVQKECLSSPGFFRCVLCGSADMVESADHVRCQSCGKQWPVRNGIYDMRTPT